MLTASCAFSPPATNSSSEEKESATVVTAAPSANTCSASISPLPIWQRTTSSTASSSTAPATITRQGYSNSATPPTAPRASTRSFSTAMPSITISFSSTPTGLTGPSRQQQEDIVKVLGKAIKRSIAVGEEDDNGIIEEIFGLLRRSRGAALPVQADQHRGIWNTAPFSNPLLQQQEDFRR